MTDERIREMEQLIRDWDRARRALAAAEERLANLISVVADPRFSWESLRDWWKARTHLRGTEDRLVEFFLHGPQEWPEEVEA